MKKREIKKSNPQLLISFLYNIFLTIKKTSIKNTTGERKIIKIENSHPRNKSATKQE